MNKSELKLNGIYKSEIFNKLKDLEIIHFGFDFRPRSFNFLQEHKFFEILKQVHQKKFYYYLRFHNEKRFVLEEFCKKINQFARDELSLVGQLPFIIEYSGVLDDLKIHELKMPYVYHLNSLDIPESLLVDPLALGFILDYDMISQTQDLHHGIDEMKEKLLHHSKKLYLDLNWNSNFMPSFLELMQVNILSLSINTLVETGYRTVNYRLVEESLDHYINHVL